MNQLPQLAYSIPDTGRAIGVSSRTVIRLLKSGRLRSAKIGRRRVISTKELERFLHESQSRTASAA
jgi:excisionase family DNA binding protein